MRFDRAHIPAPMAPTLFPHAARIARLRLVCLAATAGLVLALLLRDARPPADTGLAPPGALAVGFLLGTAALVLYFARDRPRSSRSTTTAADEVPGAAGCGRDPGQAPDGYLSALDRLPALIWRTSSDGTCDFHNLAWLEFTGRTFEEERGTGWAQGVHPDDLDPLIARFERAFAAREAFDMEYRLRHRSGEYRRISDHARPIFEEHGRFGGYLGIAVDTSARAEVDAALRESEEVFRSIFESASIGMARMDPAGRFLLANDAYLAMVGYPIDELTRLTVHEITHPDDRQRNEELFGRLLRREISSFEIQKRYARKDGRDLWVDKSVSAVFDPEGRVVYVQSIIQDITEARRDRMELEKRELMLREAQAIARMGGWEWDLSGDRVEWSDAMYELFGLPVGARPPNYPQFLQLVHPADRASLERDVDRTLEGEETETVFRIIRSDGSVRWLQGRRRLVRDRDGRPIRMTGTTQDITDLKEAEEAVRLLARAGMAFGRSLEYRETFAEVAALVVPELADICSFHLLMPSGRIERFAFLHRDPIIW